MFTGSRLLCLQLTAKRPSSSYGSHLTPKTHIVFVQGSGLFLFFPLLRNISEGKKERGSAAAGWRDKQQPLYLVTALVQMVTRKQPATIIQPQPPSGGPLRGAMALCGHAPLPLLRAGGWLLLTLLAGVAQPVGCSPSAEREEKQVERGQGTELWNHTAWLGSTAS